jgi:hypothetical protein
MGHPSKAKITSRSRKIVEPWQNQRHHGTQRQRHVDGRKHDDELGEARERGIQTPTRVACDTADQRPDQRGDECGQYGERQGRLRSVQQTRKAIPPVRVGAEEQQAVLRCRGRP